MGQPDRADTWTSACAAAPTDSVPPLVAELHAYAAAQLHSQVSVHACPLPHSSQLEGMPAAFSRMQAQVGLQAARDAAAVARQQAEDAAARMQAVQSQTAAVKQPWLGPVGAEPFFPECFTPTSAAWSAPQHSALAAASTAAAVAAAVQPLASAPLPAAPASASLLAGLVPLQAPLQLAAPPPAVLTRGRSSPLGHGPPPSTYVVPCVDANGCTGNLIVLLPGAAAAAM